MHTEILLFDGFDELDAMGPWEVLSGLAAVREDVTAQLVTLEGAREVRADHGAVIRSHAALSERPDLVLVPGGGWFDRTPDGAWAEAQRGAIPAAIAARHAAGATIASVCTGALLLAASGILDGRRATTNPGALDDLRARGTIDVIAARVVDDGDILTAGAPSCGLDLALQLAERIGGPELAETAARELQYERRPMSSGARRSPMGMRANINGAELRIDTFGDPADPAVLLIMGGAASMDRWEEPFCARLADAGRFVIRYDHRDTGESTAFPPGEPGYTSDDLAADAVGVLDACAVQRAHVVGMSMGGALAQQLAVEHPERVRSLALMSTSIAASGGPELPGMSDELRALFNGNGPTPPDWTDRDAAIEYLLEVERPFAGARGIDDDAMRTLLARTYDRASSPASADNHFMVDGSTFPLERLAAVSAPTLVIHGTHDPLLPLAHGEALERAIPDARLLVVDGLGHEFPRWAWDDVLPALIVHTA